jgi:ABC-type nitrate/sulfonate/bicarbonate transport system substrate-binding protein
MQPHVFGFFALSSYVAAPACRSLTALGLILYLILLSMVWTDKGETAERFFISIPGPTLSYAPLYYGQEKGFFSQEGLDLHVLAVRGIVGVSSLMAGEIDVTCHAGSGFSAALRRIPIKIISVTRDRRIHELIVGPAI